MTDNERVDSAFALSQLIEDIKNHLGICILAEAGHGKSFTAFSLVKQAMKDKDITVIVFSPSTIWRRKFGQINYVKVGTSEFNPIIETKRTKVEVVPYQRDTVFIDLDKKWSYQRSAWLEDLLKSKQSLLFEIKYRNGRRIKAFESVALSMIYEMQERELDINPDYNHHYIVIFEELQNSFGTFSMNSDDSLELMTIFTQSRSDALIHYIGIGQRANDISTKVIERLRPLIGLTLGENSLRKIRSQLPDDLKAKVQQLQPRHWLYLNGKDNPEIVIPEYKKIGHATQLKPKSQEPQKPKGILQKIHEFFRKKPKTTDKQPKTVKNTEYQQRLEAERQRQEKEVEEAIEQEDEELEEDLGLLGEPDEEW